MNPLPLKEIDRAGWPVAAMIGKATSLLVRYRRPDSRPLVLRPGGMGDLILLCIAAEELGCDPRSLFWVIERRSSVWARHLGLDYLCYNDALVSRHFRIAGRFSVVINSEQRFGLSQATALLALAPEAELICFETNRAARWAQRRVPYDPDRMHEVVAFQHLLAAAFGLTCSDVIPRRKRITPAVENPIVGLGGLQAESRMFSEEAWANFIEVWSQGRDFWIASAEADRQLARHLANRFRGRAELFEGKFSALCELVSKSEQVLTVDGGFVHIASYYGVPATAVFTSGRDRKWAALAPGSRVVRRSDLTCQPCTWFGQVPRCPHHFACKELNYERDLRTVAG